MVPFSVEHDVIEQEHGDVFLIDVEGDCSYENIHVLRMKLDRLHKFSATGVVIDLRKVEMIDSASLGLMIHFRDHAEMRGMKPVLCVGESIHRLLTKTNLAERFEVSRSLEEALRVIAEHVALLESKLP